MSLNPYGQGLGAALGQGQNIYSNTTGSLHVTPATPQTPEAFVVPISMEDGSIKAIVVSEGGFSRKDEARPLISMEQAQALVKALNHELEQQREAARRVAEEQEKEYQRMLKDQMECYQRVKSWGEGVAVEKYKHRLYGTSITPTAPPTEKSLAEKLKEAIKWPKI